MPVRNPWINGVVLSLTVIVSYVLCALFWFSFPGPSLELLNGLFHGLDFRKLGAPAIFSFGTFLYVLAVLAIWSYVLGAIYAVIYNRLLARPAGR
jgi:hypothetical protein